MNASFSIVRSRLTSQVGSTTLTQRRAISHCMCTQNPTILKNISESINKRLSEISSDKECFDNAKPIYQEALNKSGYRYNLPFNATLNQSPRPLRNRKRNITWFNPSYSKNVETNVGKCFLSLIDKHFPKSNPLHKIFNRNTLKLSYSCITKP